MAESSPANSERTQGLKELLSTRIQFSYFEVLRWIAFFILVVFLSFFAGNATFRHQLWNRGIDIWSSAISNLISGVVLALIAGIAYKYKLDLDMFQERRKAALHHEMELERQNEQRDTRLRELRATANKFAVSTRAMSLIEARDQARGFVAWLKQEGIDHLNGTTVTAFDSLLSEINFQTSPEELAERLAQLMERVVIE